MADDIVDVSPQTPNPPVYLGDGLYASNGTYITYEVHLDPGVLNAFMHYVAWTARNSIVT